MWSLWPAFAATVVLLCFALPARATTLRALDVDALTTSADRIFVGRVETVESGRDAAGFSVTWTTFIVDEAVKGVLPARLTIKQLASGAIGAGGLFRVPGLPEYRAGERVLLFLHADSSAGFTSPVGLTQGCFRVRGSGADATIENDVGNLNLADTAPSTAISAPPGARRAADTTARGPALRLDAMLERVRALDGGGTR